MGEGDHAKRGGGGSLRMELWAACSYGDSEIAPQAFGIA